MAMFATPDDLSSHLGQPVDEARATIELESASAIIQAYCDASLTPVNGETVTVPLYSGHTANVPGYPVTSVDSVQVKDFSGSWQTLDGSNYNWDAAGSVWLTLPWWKIEPAIKPYGYVQVTYSYGYAIVPDAVKAVCLSLAARTYVNPYGVLQQNTGGVSYSYGSRVSSQLGDYDKLALDRFCLPMVA